MQFLQNQLPRILKKILETAKSRDFSKLNSIQCGAHSPHLNYTTTLPRKTVTMKITIFIIVKE